MAKNESQNRNGKLGDGSDTKVQVIIDVDADERNREEKEFSVGTFLTLPSVSCSFSSSSRRSGAPTKNATSVGSQTVWRILDISQSVATGTHVVRMQKYRVDGAGTAVPSLEFCILAADALINAEPLATAENFESIPPPPLGANFGPRFGHKRRGGRSDEAIQRRNQRRRLQRANRREAANRNPILPKVPDPVSATTTTMPSDDSRDKNVIAPAQPDKVDDENKKQQNKTSTE